MLIIWNTLLILYFLYFLYQIGNLEKGIIKNIILIFLSLGTLLISVLFNKVHLGWLLITFYMALYDLFYDKEPFSFQCSKILLGGFIIFLMTLLNISYVIIIEVLFVFSFIIFSKIRNYSNILNNFFVILVYVIIISLSCLLNEVWITYTLFLLSLIIFLMLEITLINYEKGFERNTRHYEHNLLQHQYEEIKNIYLDMRGWRHDYHNHLQVIKAHLALNQLKEVDNYLRELETDLDSVDTYVKSGNLMIDAILNSKISLAEKHDINVICKAQVPENIPISEVDLCVILGNLLDNATEACELISKEKRFVRIYITILKKQLYISIQNSAKEELNFNEKNYISTKRGNHGLGMKRVMLLVDKYNGYCNLQNEAGIFASEVTIPLI